MADANCCARFCPKLNCLGWALVVALLVAQFVLFRQYVRREVVGLYPPSHDQLQFLDWSYLSALRMRHDFWGGLEQAAGCRESTIVRNTPGKVTLPASVMAVGNVESPPSTELLFTLEGSLGAYLFGPGRLTALTIQFLHWAAFQIVLVATLRWLTGRWSIPLIALGLLLSTSTPFFFAGGLFDFRMDFATLCLYGILICLILRSNLFADWRWSVLAGLVGAMLFSLRVLTLAYLIGVLGLVGLLLVWRWWRQRKTAPAESFRRVRNLFIACAIIAAVAAPILYDRFQSLRAYYVVGHISGPEKKIRALAEGIRTMADALWYYPASLYFNHAGPFMAWMARWLMVAGVILLAFRWIKDRRGIKTTIDRSGAVVLLLAAALVPLALLSLDEAKSPVVVNIMIPPLVVGVAMAIAMLAGTFRDSKPHPVARVLLSIMAGWCLFRGGKEMVRQYHQRVWSQPERAGVGKLMRIYDHMAEAAVDLGWNAPLTGFDSTWDGLNYRAWNIMTYERSHQMLRPAEILAKSIFAAHPEKQTALLRQADLIVLTEAPAPGPKDFEFDFDHMSRELKPKFLMWCRSNYVELDHARFAAPREMNLTVFVRPVVRVETDADGWMHQRGTHLVSLAEILRNRPEIELTGPAGSTALQPPAVSAALVAPGLAPIPVPASLTAQDGVYHLNLHVDPSRLSMQGRVQIDLQFGGKGVEATGNGTIDSGPAVLRIPASGAVLPPLPPE